MENYLEIALIGAGRFGRTLATVLNCHFWRKEIKSIYNPSCGAARQLAQEVNAVPVLSLDEIWQDKTIDAVIIASPNTTHPAMVKSAAQAGKHVFCEKPIAFTVTDCDSMIEDAKRHNVKFMVGHLLRFYAVPCKIKEIIDGGEIGIPFSFNIERTDGLFRQRDWFSKKESVGGILYQTTIHEFDFLRSLFQRRRVKELAVLKGKSKIREILDYPELMHSTLEIRNGVIGHIYSFMSDAAPRYQGGFTGTGGTLIFDVRKGVVRLISRNNAERELYWSPDGWKEREESPHDNLVEGELPAIKAELENFCRFIGDEADCLLTPEAGRRAVEFSQAGYISIAERSPVVLPLNEEWQNRRAYLEI